LTPAPSHAGAAPPPRGDASDVAALRTDLAESGYTVEGIEAVLGPVAADALDREQAVPARGVVRGRPEPAAVLLSAFVLGEAARRRDVDAALPRLRTAGAIRCGLLAAAGEEPDDEVRAIVDLSPYAAEDARGRVEWWLTSDVGELASGRPLAPDHVLGVGGASTTLARITVREPVGRVLDIGTGCGIQALHANRHAGHVVATDISTRALRFARFNSALAEVDVELRAGSMLEPAGGERFDLVVSNPPFVITPRTRDLPQYSYRDAGRTGDDLVRDLVTSLGDVLLPGGIAQLLGSWEHREGEDWRERVGQWLDASGLDGWVIQREVADPAQYAETWLRDGGLTPDRDTAAWRAGYESWLADFEARDVEAVGFGYVVLRRPVAGGRTLRRLEEQEAAIQEPLGAHIGASLRAHDWLGALDEAALAAARLAVADDVTEERYYRPGDADPRLVLLRQGGGLGRVLRADTELAGIVGACDGELSVGTIIAAVASLVGSSTAELIAAQLPVVRDLVRDGFLTLAGRAPASPAGAR
jgi:SAM-dependent methyltransferase